ncbi:hypothetical protein [Lysinibacillus odysseyi]|uniref:Uncharacterized protein n=1 Tax=Lysinibacillus odysseyi 34hs-1 = NBRC 100172 TaxID=1220589 RepID=A0A0A3J0M7_9BACI|nr:hypothetical protein [Lysinibacillus odysseyi]KGR88708.1 hypothetical protein CD32_01185 [Lysinibacillus odysseyi 34hs-1 = NBRC 100172]
MDKRQKRKMLYELEHLIQTKGDKNRIAELRDQLGMEVEEKEETYTFTEEQFFRMKALGLTEAEMAFITSTNARKVRYFREKYTKEQLEEGIKKYGTYSAVRHSARARCAYLGQS